MAKNKKKNERAPSVADGAGAPKDVAVKGGRAKPQALRFSKVNAGLGVAGAATVALGYMLLAQGSITAAPLLLVLGYVVLLPMALVL